MPKRTNKSATVMTDFEHFMMVHRIAVEEYCEKHRTEIDAFIAKRLVELGADPVPHQCKEQPGTYYATPLVMELLGECSQQEHIQAAVWQRAYQLFAETNPDGEMLHR